MRTPAVLVFTGVLVAIASFAPQLATAIEQPTLLIYEPNRVGYTDDGDDVAFLDFQLSFLFGIPGVNEWLAKHPAYVPSGIHVAFTTRLGQYIGNRHSSPVIGKRFNPKFIVRWEWKNMYFDAAYAHESNGQNIDDADKFDAEVTALNAREEDADFANDLVSRGWDLVELKWAVRKPPSIEGGLSVYVTAAHFLDDGILQGEPGEIHEFESDTEISKRREVHGLNALAAFRIKIDKEDFSEMKFALSYDTGIGIPFQNHSIRFDVTATAFGLPITLWAARGHGSDLAQFNQEVTSLGVGLEFKPFAIR